MASSRWKRFAFFDRHTLSLPPDVVNDLVPVPSSISSEANTNASSHTDGGASLAVVSVELPVTEVTQYQAQDDKRKQSTNSTSRRQGQGQGQGQGRRRQEETGGIAGMLSSMNACTAPEVSFQFSADDDDDDSSDSSDSSDSQSQARPAHRDNLTLPAAQSRDETPDGHALVLLFASSPHTHLVHCVDLTVRCNPLHKPANVNTNARRSSVGKNAKDDWELESLDGWRGHFDPFASSMLNVGVGGQSPSSPQQKRGVLDMAVCALTRDSLAVCAITDPSQWEGQCPGVVLHRNPHLHLSCVPPHATTSTSMPEGLSLAPTSPWDSNYYGLPRVVDMIPGIVAVGTDTGMVLIYTYAPSSKSLKSYMEIPAPHADQTSVSASASSTPLVAVSSVKLITPLHRDAEDVNTTNNNRTKHAKETRVKLYVCYQRSRPDTEQPKKSSLKEQPEQASASGRMGTGGMCCYDLGLVSSSLSTASSHHGPSARYDLDGRDVPSSGLCDTLGSSSTLLSSSSHTNSNPHHHSDEYLHYIVARSDGLYTYSTTDKVAVSPIDGHKIAMCAIPPPPVSRRFILPSQPQPHHAGMDVEGHVPNVGGGASYALVATTDDKSGRDAVDIYDATNKLVAFHVLLSPGHRTLRAIGVTTVPTTSPTGDISRGGRSSAIVLTSGGSIVTLTEKATLDKVNLLVQKNLYGAAISMAYADPSYEPEEITALYRRHAEHLYRKGDFTAAMDQYVFTIGSLEPSHVIFRYLDAPKIPLLTKYLEVLRTRDLATPVHNELLRTCYLKLNDTAAAEKISAAASTSMDASSLASIVSSLTNNPAEALATICSFEAPQAAEALLVHGATLARALPRETAGVVVSLCVGSYSPSALADAAAGSQSLLLSSQMDLASTLLENSALPDDAKKVCDQYPVHLFSSAFLENPKLLRLILAHCNRNNCLLNPSLRRTLLELTLEEWNNAKRTGDKELEKQRRNEAMSALTDNDMEDIGDYEALVIVQLAGFAEGEVLMYERLQMAPMLLERYAKDGGDRARRQMLAMCRSDPELLADVLGYFVGMASDKLGHSARGVDGKDDEDDDSDSDGEADEIMDDIREALNMARAQSVLPPVRIARILAGEGVGQFSVDDSRRSMDSERASLPLSVALDYVGTILDDSSGEIARLKTEVEEYNNLCNSMETEIETLLASTTPQKSEDLKNAIPHINIEKMYAHLRESLEESNANTTAANKTETAQEEFWREMEHSEDRFDTISRYFGKGIIP